MNYFAEIFRKVMVVHALTLHSMRTHANVSLYKRAREHMARYYDYSARMYQEWRCKGVLVNQKCPACGSDRTRLEFDRAAIDSSRYERCMECSFLYANPMPSEEYYNEIYVSSFGGLDTWWYGQKQALGEAEDTAYEGAYRDLERIWQRKPSGTFLDYGCGTGWLLEKLKDTYDVYGVDLDESRIAEARGRLGDAHEKIAALSELDGQSFVERFDIIHCSQTLEHLLDPMTYLEKFYTWLRPGGILYLSFPCSDSFAMSFFEEHNTVSVLGHVSLFTKQSILRALRSVGFSRVEAAHGGLDVSALELWKRIFGIECFHQYAYIESSLLCAVLYPIMFMTTTMLNVLAMSGIVKCGNITVVATKG